MLKILERYKVIGTDTYTTIEDIRHGLRVSVHLALTIANLRGLNGGTQQVTIGSDDGRTKNAKRTDTLVPLSYRLTTWSVANATHDSPENQHGGRTLVPSELRRLLLASGIQNVTTSVVEHNSAHVALLGYRTHDGLTHFHVRPVNAVNPIDSQGNRTLGERDYIYADHQAIFDAAGAGFKISMAAPIAPTDPNPSSSDADVISDAIAKDIVYNKQSKTYVGYGEHYSDNGAPGHKLCIIAEQNRFGLNIETGRCGF